MTTHFVRQHFALLVSAMAFVAFAVAGTVILGQGDPRHHGEGCEWNEFGEVVCEPPTERRRISPTDLWHETCRKGDKPCQGRHGSLNGVLRS